jgi:hypothetical protein
MHKNRVRFLAAESGFLQKFFMFYEPEYAIILTKVNEEGRSAKERL